MATKAEITKVLATIKRDGMPIQGQEKKYPIGNGKCIIKVKHDKGLSSDSGWLYITAETNNGTTAGSVHSSFGKQSNCLFPNAKLAWGDVLNKATSLIDKINATIKLDKNPSASEEVKKLGNKGFVIRTFFFENGVAVKAKDNYKGVYIKAWNNDKQYYVAGYKDDTDGIDTAVRSKVCDKIADAVNWANTIYKTI